MLKDKLSVFYRRFITFLLSLKNMAVDKRLINYSVVFVLVAVFTTVNYLILESREKGTISPKLSSVESYQTKAELSDTIEPDSSDLTALEPASENKEPQIIKYIVRSGDTLDSISKIYNVKTSTVSESNGLSNNSVLKEGQELQFPSIDGVIHKIKEGETTWDLTVTYKVDLDKIVSINKMDSPDRLKIGQQIIIPGAEKLKTINNAVSFASVGGMWPLRGNITSKYGLRWGSRHKGLDIAAPSGTSIYAFLNGKVKFSGWDSGGYGYLIIIDHGNGLESYYAHNSKLLVNPGEYVEKGQQIARVGSTGDSTGPHSHFEVRKYGEPTNPYNYLN